MHRWQAKPEWGRLNLMRCEPSLKKQKNVDEGATDTDFEGDAWIYAGIKRDTKFIVGFAVGKRTRGYMRPFSDAYNGWDGTTYPI
jgi:hypothetical protein